MPATAMDAIHADLCINVAIRAHPSSEHITVALTLLDGAHAAKRVVEPEQDAAQVLRAQLQQERAAYMAKQQVLQQLEAELQRQRMLLHQSNDAQDAAQTLVEKLATATGQLARSIYEQFDML